MAFFQLLLKANKIDRTKNIYLEEKLKSIELSKTGDVHYTFAQRIRIWKILFKRKIKDFWKKFPVFPEDSWIRKKIVLIRTDGTLENFVVKSLFGFLGGIFFTYLLFMLFVLHLNFSLFSATLLCSFIGIVLTLGLAFSSRIRCIVFLLLPHFFSKRGRQIMIAYAFILALTGPAKNILHNTRVLSESLACVQEQLSDALRAVLDLIKTPFYALKVAITKVIRAVKIIVRKIKQSLLVLKRLVLSILKVIKSVFQWLGSVVNICNKKLGTPFERCQKVFKDAVDDCKIKLGPIIGEVCNITYVVGSICYVVKPFDFICMLVSYVSDSIIDAVKKKIKKFTKHMRAMFYVKIKFSHSYHFETNRSKTAQEISSGISTEIKSRTETFLAFFDWMSFVTAFFILLMLLRVLHYRHKWLTRDHYDNKYISKDLRDIDLVRAKKDQETVLPLNPREKKKYIPLTSIILIKSERKKLAKSAVFLGLATLKLLIYIAADYSLYWILSTIRYHGRFETKVQRPNSVGVYVSGNGYLADLYRSIVHAFTPYEQDVEIDTIPCLPDPIPPNYDRYTQIISLIILSWFIVVVEPYGLRLRQVVMSYYHPERAKQRAVWLYNRIIRSRGSFLKYARRQLRRKFGATQVEKVTLRDRLETICPLLFRLLCPRKENLCLLCGSVEQEEFPHIKCPTPNCVGFFCMSCFSDLQNVCPICRSPMDFGDLSDVSEEKDSSEDQYPMQTPKKETELQTDEVEKEKETIVTFADEIEEHEDEEQKLIAEEKAEGGELKERKFRRLLCFFRKLKKEDSLSTKDDRGTISVDQKRRVSRDDKGENRKLEEQDEDEEPDEVDTHRHRQSFKDIEAQKIRDDATLQVFNDPILREDTTSTSEALTSCFMRKCHKKLRSKMKKKCSCLEKREDSISTPSVSVADVDFSPTEISGEESEGEEEEEEEVQGEEEEIVADIRNDDTFQSRADLVDSPKKKHRAKKIVDAIINLPFLRRTKEISRRSSIPDPSVIKKVAKMLESKSFTPNYETCEDLLAARYKERRISTSSSSSSAYEGNEETMLLNSSECEQQGKAVIIDFQDYYGKAESPFSSDSFNREKLNFYTDRSRSVRDSNMEYPCTKRFETQTLPRYLEPSVKDMKFFEVDETSSSHPSLLLSQRIEDNISSSISSTICTGKNKRTRCSKSMNKFSTNESTNEEYYAKTDAESISNDFVPKEHPLICKGTRILHTNVENLSPIEVSSTNKPTSGMSTGDIFPTSSIHGPKLVPRQSTDSENEPMSKHSRRKISQYYKHLGASKREERKKWLDREEKTPDRRFKKSGRKRKFDISEEKLNDDMYEDFHSTGIHDFSVSEIESDEEEKSLILSSLSSRKKRKRQKKSNIVGKLTDALFNMFKSDKKCDEDFEEKGICCIEDDGSKKESLMFSSASSSVDCGCDLKRNESKEVITNF